MEHAKENCLVKEKATHQILGDLYGPWIIAEVETAILIKDNDLHRRVENPRNEHFDSFSNDTNTDTMNTNEDKKVQFDGDEDGEVRET